MFEKHLSQPPVVHNISKVMKHRRAQAGDIDPSTPATGNIDPITPGTGNVKYNTKESKNAEPENKQNKNIDDTTSQNVNANPVTLQKGKAPPIVSNGTSVAESLQKLTIGDDVDRTVSMVTKSGKLAARSLPHSYAEGLDFTLTDIMLYVIVAQIEVCLLPLGQILDKGYCHNVIHLFRRLSRCFFVLVYAIT